jgi:citrate synthase
MEPGTTAADSASSSLAVRDLRTGREYDIPIVDDAIRAADLARVIGDDDQPDGLVSYDPAFMNTASCRSAITYIDGDRGILRYRGYPIEDLAGRFPFLDVAYLLIHGDLPTDAASDDWARAVGAGSAALPAEVVELISTFPTDAHPMTVLLAAWSALAAYRPATRAPDDAATRDAETPIFLGLVASVVALVVRHRMGRPARLDPPIRPYAANLLAQLFPDSPDATDPTLATAIDVLLILQADHEQNCSTNAVRAVGSSRVDPYSATAAGIAALFGPLHGGANEAVIRMLHDIERVENVPRYIARVKDGEHRLMGFGQRVYKSYDPRARIIKATAERVFERTGTNPLLDVALEVERIALADDYFVSRKLYPNVDFYTGLIYEAMGLPMDTYTTLFAVARMAGWVAQWREMVVDPEQKIARPRQIYVGPGRREVPSAVRRRRVRPPPALPPRR